jgi:hypothetical protein
MLVHEQTPISFHGLGLMSPPAEDQNRILASLKPKAKRIESIDDIVKFRDYIIFRKRNEVIDIAYLGSIYGPIAPGQTDRNVLVGYIYGPNAGTAKFIPLQTFLSDFWHVVDREQDPFVIAFVGITKPPVYPYNPENVLESINLVIGWVKNGLERLKADDIEGGKHALRLAADNVEIAYHRLRVVRDSGFPQESLRGILQLIASANDKADELRQAIRASQADFMTRIGNYILSLFYSSGAKLSEYLGQTHQIARKKVIELYEKRKNAEIFLRELLKLPQTGVIPSLVDYVSQDIRSTNEAITSIKNELVKYGTNLKDLFGLDESSLSAVPAFLVSIVAFIGRAVVESILFSLIYRLLNPSNSIETSREFASMVADELAKRNIGTTISIHELVAKLAESEFRRLLRENPSMTENDLAAARKAATDYATSGLKLENIDDLRKIADGRILRAYEELKKEVGLDKNQDKVPSESNNAAIVVGLIFAAVAIILVIKKVRGRPNDHPRRLSAERAW